MIEATATDRHTTVARKSASASVTDPYAITTYELTVTNRRDVPHYLTRVRTRAERICAQWELSRRCATVAGLNPRSIRYFPAILFLRCP